MKTIKTTPWQMNRVSKILVVGMLFFAAAINATEFPLSAREDSVFEEEIAIESWMTEPDSWITNPDKMVLLEAAEEEIELENWMHNPDNEFWSEINFSEEEYPVEAWMASPWNWTEANQEQLLSIK